MPPSTPVSASASTAAAPSCDRCRARKVSPPWLTGDEREVGGGRRTSEGFRCCCPSTEISVPNRPCGFDSGLRPDQSSSGCCWGRAMLAPAAMGVGALTAGEMHAVRDLGPMSSMSEAGQALHLHIRTQEARPAAGINKEEDTFVVGAGFACCSRCSRCYCRSRDDRAQSDRRDNTERGTNGRTDAREPLRFCPTDMRGPLCPTR